MKHIAVIGGIAVDMEGRPFGPLNPSDSNPGAVLVSHGGVGRNIAENLHRMGDNRISLLSAVGEDVFGRDALDNLAQSGLDPGGILRMPRARTAIYLSILDEEGEMVLALSDMEVLERITPAQIQDFSPALADASALALDANLTEEALEFCARRFSDKRIFVDPVSVEKSRRIRNILPSCYALKPNRVEAEALSGLALRSGEDLRVAGNFFLEQGVRMVFISLGAEGLFYMDRNGPGRLDPPKVEAVVSVTGAGDAMSAAIVDGIARDLDIGAIARNAVLASSLTLQVRETVHKDIGSFWKR